MAEKITNWIQENRFISKIGYANDNTGIFLHIITAFVLFYALIKPSTQTSIFIWNLILVMLSGVFVFYFAYALIDQASVSEAIVITVASLLPYASLMMIQYLVLLPIYGVFTAYMMAFVFRLAKQMRSNIKDIPPAVNQTFNQIIPIFAVIIVSMTLGTFFDNQGYRVVVGTVNILEILGSIYAVTLVIIAICYLWSKGIHGANIVGKALRLLYLQLIFLNINNFIYGIPMVYFGAETFYQWVVWIGGSGTTLGLAIALRFFAKSQELKYIGKTSYSSAIFNINEGIIFGIPIMENKEYIIPFYLTPLACAWISYFAITLGWVRFPILSITWVAPVPIGLFLSSIFDWKALILAFVLILVSMLIYLPFMIKDDRKRLMMEKN